MCRFSEGCDDVLAHDRLEQFFLVLEVEVQRSLGNARACSDVLEARSRVALFHEKIEYRRQQFGRTCLLAPLPPRAGRGDFDAAHSICLEARSRRRTIALARRGRVLEERNPRFAAASAVFLAGSIRNW